MSAELLLGTYGRLLHGATDAITFKRRVPVADLESAREKGQKA
jgi:hypothetical protein